MAWKGTSEISQPNSTVYESSDSTLSLPSYEPPCQNIDSVGGCLLTTALFNCQLIDNKKNISYSL